MTNPKKPEDKVIHSDSYDSSPTQPDLPSFNPDATVAYGEEDKAHIARQTRTDLMEFSDETNPEMEAISVDTRVLGSNANQIMQQQHPLPEKTFVRESMSKKDLAQHERAMRLNQGLNVLRNAGYATVKTIFEKYANENNECSFEKDSAKGVILDNKELIALEVKSKGDVYSFEFFPGVRGKFTIKQIDSHGKEVAEFLLDEYEDRVSPEIKNDHQGDLQISDSSRFENEFFKLSFRAQCRVLTNEGFGADIVDIPRVKIISKLKPGKDQSVTLKKQGHFLPWQS